jgi:nucleoside-diphosphate kinase
MAIERTLVLLKPDCIQRRLCGVVLQRLETKGLKLVGMKLLRVSPELSREHYVEHVSKPFYPQLEAFITSGPVIALALEGLDAVQVVRTMMGPTNGRSALPGTIRGDFGMSRQMNLVHGSDSVAAAERELKLYFRPEELVSYSLVQSALGWAADEA